MAWLIASMPGVGDEERRHRADRVGVEDRDVGQHVVRGSGSLAWLTGSVITAKEVTSEPVPLVVGIT